MGGWSNLNHPAHLRVMNRRSQLTVTRDNTPIPRSIEARNLEINQARGLKPRLTSRSGAVTWKAIILTLVQYHPTNSPGQWRNWRNTLDQHTVTDDSHTSWLKPRPPFPTHRRLSSLIWAPNAQKQMQRWLNSIKITLMKPSVKIWGRRISMNQKFTIYKISLWDKQMNNYNRSWRQTPPSRCSILTKNQ